MRRAGLPTDRFEPVVCWHSELPTLEIEQPGALITSV